jgi:hypothetical protein
VVGSDVMKRIIEIYEAGDLITTCAWCGRVEFDGEWLFPSRAALTAIDAPNTLSHTLCPKCATLPKLLGPLPDRMSDPRSTTSLHLAPPSVDPIRIGRAEPDPDA